MILAKELQDAHQHRVEEEGEEGADDEEMGPAHEVGRWGSTICRFLVEILHPKT